MAGNEKTKWFAELDKSAIAIAGGKDANLGELVRAEMPVPPGFVIANAGGEIPGGSLRRVCATHRPCETGGKWAEFAPTTKPTLETTHCDSFAQSVGDKLLAESGDAQGRRLWSGAQDMPDASSAER